MSLVRWLGSFRGDAEPIWPYFTTVRSVTATFDRRRRHLRVTDAVRSECKDDVLAVRIPKVEKEKAKQIAVQ